MNLSFGPGDARFRKTFSACSLHAERRRNPEAATDCAKETRLMRRRTRGKEVENVIDRESARLDDLPEATLAQRVQKIAADRGRWSVKRLNGNWALFDENGLTDFRRQLSRKCGVPTRAVHGLERKSRHGGRTVSRRLVRALNMIS